jgi:hypothetical protein
MGKPGAMGTAGMMGEVGLPALVSADAPQYRILASNPKAYPGVFEPMRKKCLIQEVSDGFNGKPGGDGGPGEGGAPGGNSGDLWIQIDNARELKLVTKIEGGLGGDGGAGGEGGPGGAGGPPGALDPYGVAKREAARGLTGPKGNRGPQGQPGQLGRAGRLCLEIDGKTSGDCISGFSDETFPK